MPGAAGPLEELVERVHRQIEQFAADYGDAAVEVELVDGSRFELESLSPEPGFGFLTLTPHGEEVEPRREVVPVGAIKRISIGRVEHAASPFGFSLPAPKPRN